MRRSSKRFNARDLVGMDALLHFPRVILSGEQLVIWQEPGHPPPSFFEDLAASTGWHHTAYQAKHAVEVLLKGRHPLTLRKFKLAAAI